MLHLASHNGDSNLKATPCRGVGGSSVQVVCVLYPGPLDTCLQRRVCGELIDMQMYVSERHEEAGIPECSHHHLLQPPF